MLEEKKDEKRGHGNSMVQMHGEQKQTMINWMSAFFFFFVDNAVASTHKVNLALMKVCRAE